MLELLEHLRKIQSASLSMKLLNGLIVTLHIVLCSLVLGVGCLEPVAFFCKVLLALYNHVLHVEGVFLCPLLRQKVDQKEERLSLVEDLSASKCYESIG